jgi:hypothetical protein
MIKGLADAFFSVFNPFTPIMDKSFFFSFTLGSAIESGFGYTMETCIVLNIMALGCLAVLAHQEGNYPLPGTQSHRFEPPEWMNVVYEEQPGLRFFNEARRRIGFLMCDNDLQSCQFYLLSSYVHLDFCSCREALQVNQMQCLLQSDPPSNGRMGDDTPRCDLLPVNADQVCLVDTSRIEEC